MGNLMNYASEALTNVIRRWEKLTAMRANPKYIDLEQKEVEEVVTGKVRIIRRAICGSCKEITDCNVRIQIQENSSYIQRTFTCEECGNIVKVDYVLTPRINCFL